ncbi:MAG: ABC transporter ATP-binding protein [Actinomycetota bacterium]|nr:ABC transporter ATP-binding protein [Actinomycetota bacterium]
MASARRRGTPAAAAPASTEDLGSLPSPGLADAAPIEVRGVSKAFVDPHGHQLLALVNVDLVIEAGTFVSLIGPSGCGKSTLLRIMGGLDQPSTGTLRVNAATGAAGTGPQSAFVFQDYGLMPWLTVVDNVAFGLKMAGVGKTERRERARVWLARVGLAGFERAYPEQLSGGMRQRLSLARAFVTEPDVLFMDEPMGAVDPQTRLLLQEDLLRIWEETRKTVVLVTHSLDEALLLGDRVVVMTARPGRVKLDLPVELERPRTVATTGGAAFASLRNTLWEALRDEVARSMELS